MTHNSAEGRCSVLLPYDLESLPVHVNLKDYNGLEFGKRYRVIKGFAANRGGQMTEGQEAYFLGFNGFHYVGGLRLFFEALDGVQFHLAFEGDIPSTPGVLNGMPEGSHYFVAVEDESSRGKVLAEARVAIENLACIAKAQKEVERKAARKPYERILEETVKEFRLSQSPANKFVYGTTDSLDFAHLEFGHQYHVTENITLPEGVLAAGQDVRFLGSSGNVHSMALYFETRDTTVSVWFVPDGSPLTKVLRRRFGDFAAYLRPVLNDVSKRRDDLDAARALLLDARKAVPKWR